MRDLASRGIHRSRTGGRPRERHLPPLRRQLLLGAIAWTTLTGSALVGILVLANAMQASVARTTTGFLADQRLADRVVEASYGQRVAAYREIAFPDPQHRAEFREHSDSAYTLIRQYLFRDLALPARLAVEAMRTEHEHLDVAAERAFDDLARGDRTAAAADVGAVRDAAAALREAVQRFLVLRDADRVHAAQEAIARFRWFEAGAIALVLLSLLLTLPLAAYLRRRLLDPVAALADAADCLGRGELDARVPAQRDQEFALLAERFNTMADDLQAGHAELEAQREEVAAQNEELLGALERLQATQAELVQHEKLSALGGMLAGLAHELNNPLGGVLGFGDLLAAELADLATPEAAELDVELVQPLLREARRARDLVRHLLHFARKGDDTLSAVDLATCVAVPVTLREGAFRQAGIALAVELPPDLVVLGEARRLEHIVLNLLANAYDAVRDGGGERVTLSAARDGAHVVLTCADDGPGFAHPERVLDPFYTTKGVGAGTGLGLALVHRFVEEFQGRISVANRPAPDHGAVVTIRFRAAHPLAATAPEPTGLPGAGDGLTAPGVRPVLESESGPLPRVLVVDDEPAIREVQRRVLRRAGFAPCLAASGDEAQALLEREDVDAIVCDVRMPGTLDGFALWQWITVARPHLAPGFMLLTGDVQLTDAALPDALHGRLLSKPFDKAEYIARVQTLVAATQRAARRAAPPAAA